LDPSQGEIAFKFPINYSTKVILNLIMVESKSKDDRSKEGDTRVAVKSSDVTKSINEIAEENYTTIIDVIIKIQPHYTQAISNLQSDYIQSIKNIIEVNFLAQEHVLGTNIFIWSNTLLATLYIQQSDALTNNIIRSPGTNNQLAINALEAARNNLETYNNIVKVVTELNGNAVTSWNPFLYTQQRFFK
jgi:hypothetical protein